MKFVHRKQNTHRQKVPETVSASADAIQEVVRRLSFLNSIGELSAALREHDQKCMEMGQKAYDEVAKIGELYTSMTYYRNKLTLLVTKLTDIYEKIHVIALTNDGKSIANLERTTLRLLNSFGVAPIFPDKNDELDNERFEVITTTECTGANDLAGHVAECVRMGIERDGVVVRAAQVILFAEQA